MSFLHNATARFRLERDSHEMTIKQVPQEPGAQQINHFDEKMSELTTSLDRHIGNIENRMTNNRNE
jgi:hypothetical protein